MHSVPSKAVHMTGGAGMRGVREVPTRTMLVLRKNRFIFSKKTVKKSDRLANDCPSGTVESFFNTTVVVVCVVVRGDTIAAYTARHHTEGVNVPAQSMSGRFCRHCSPEVLGSQWKVATSCASGGNPAGAGETGATAVQSVLTKGVG